VRASPWRGGRVGYDFLRNPVGDQFGRVTQLGAMRALDQPPDLVTVSARSAPPKSGGTATCGQLVLAVLRHGILLWRVTP